MDKKDIIEAEIVEEVVETFPVEQDSEPEIHYTDEEIDEKIANLKEMLGQNEYKTNDSIIRLAKEIASNTKDYLDNDTYLWIMYTFALKYRAEGNTNAERFCFIRSKSVLDACMNKRKKQAALTFVEPTITEDMRNEIINNTSFMDSSIKSLKMQFIGLEVVMLVVFSLFMVIFLDYALITTIGFSLILVGVNYMLTYRSLFDRYIKEQTETSKTHCSDNELIQFDLPVYLS